jgi:Glycoside hydrolase 123, N-terminal domain
MRGAVIAAMAVSMSLGLAAGPQDLDVKYGVGSWDPESGLGNHRAVVHVAAAAGSVMPSSRKDPAQSPAVMPLPKPAAVRVRIPWRRRDADPDKKNLMVFDAATGARVTNVLVLTVGRETGDLVFEPKAVPGDYYVYFMPYRSEGRKNYPNVKYDPPQATADPAWLAAAGLGA